MDNLVGMSLPAAPFGRVLTAMVTPFTADGSVDLDGVAKVAAHLVDHGNDGLVVSGTTGEAPTTTVAEDGQILRAVIDAVGDRCTVVAGVGTNHTEHSVELARQAQDAGADGVLLVSPYYNKPTQAGIAAHFEAVAAASDLRDHALRHPRTHRRDDRAGDLRRGWRPTRSSWPSRTRWVTCSAACRSCSRPA